MFTIYVANLSYSTTEDALRSLFAQYGTVEGVNIIRDWGSGLSRGFGFVDMTNEAEGQQAIAGLDGKEFEGRKLFVTAVRPKS